MAQTRSWCVFLLYSLSCLRRMYIVLELSVQYKDATGARFFSQFGAEESAQGPSCEVWILVDGSDQELVRPFC